MKNIAAKHAIVSSLLWLLVGVGVGLWLALHYAFPNYITNLSPHWQQYLEFGKMRQVHVNILAFAWLSISLLGCLLYALPLLSKTRLRYTPLAVAAVYIWNVGLLVGVMGLLLGYSRGREYAEMNWVSDAFLLVSFAFLLIVAFSTLANREVKRMNVATWYLLGSLVWMPLIIILGKGLWKDFTGIPFNGYFDNVANWFLGHNILGLWFTTLGIGISYFIIPRVTKKPIYNHYFSLIGFWSLALFYPAVGAHHTLGGPIPKWLMSEATVCSVLMIIPVSTALWNLYKSADPHWELLWQKPSLTFISAGLFMYLIVSLQGSFQALMFVSNYLHFSQWVPAHAMLALGGGFSFISFGAIYHILPRLIQKNFFSSKLTAWHLWLSLLGIAGIFFSLTAAGLVQGANWQNAVAGMHWIDGVVRSVKPEMLALVVAGAIFIAGQLLFILNVLLTLALGRVITLQEQEDILPPSGTFIGRKFKFESSLPLMVVFMLLVYSFAFVTTYLIPYEVAKTIKPDGSTVKYSVLQEHGRKVYIREGCLWCHSQMVRPSEANLLTVFRRGDVGNVTTSAWYFGQGPALMGQHRRGPDLSHTWSRWPSDFWQREHLKKPGALNPGTWMPPFAYLSPYDQGAVVAYLKTLR